MSDLTGLAKEFHKIGLRRERAIVLLMANGLRKRDALDLWRSTRPKKEKRSKRHSDKKYEAPDFDSLYSVRNELSNRGSGWETVVLVVAVLVLVFAIVVGVVISCLPIGG